MQTRMDIISSVTGRVLLSSLLDAPSDGLTRAETWAAIRILQRAKRELEKKFGENSVRLSLDSYEGTVFWLLLLLRPILFDKRHPQLGLKKWSVHEMLHRKDTAKLLTISDLGLVVDRENMWLALNWKAARKGILKDFEKCPSWRAIIAKQRRRLDRAGIKEKVGEDYWKRCARSFSYTIPSWQLEKMSYLKSKVWHLGQMTYDDLIVLDIDGIDIPKLDPAMESIKLPVAKRARFAHFYTDDPREYRAVQKEATKEKRERNLKTPIHGARRASGQRDRRQMRAELGEKQAWYDASRILSKLPRLLGKGLKSGRYAKFLSGKRSDQLYITMLDAYMNGEVVDPDKKNLGIHLAALENLLEDENVPKEFEKWLNWKGDMKKIRKEVET